MQSLPGKVPCRRHGPQAMALVPCSSHGAACLASAPSCCAAQLSEAARLRAHGAPGTPDQCSECRGLASGALAAAPARGADAKPVQCGQSHSPSGTASRGGERQCMWKDWRRARARAKVSRARAISHARARARAMGGESARAGKAACRTNCAAATCSLNTTRALPSSGGWAALLRVPGARARARVRRAPCRASRG